MRPLKIAYAEDDGLFRRHLVAILEREGHTVDAVANGWALIEMLSVETIQARVYDVVITDNRMPIKFGMDALEHIRKWASAEKLPVILHSNDDMIEKQVSELGGVFLLKSIGEHLVLRELRRLQEAAVPSA